MNYCHSVTFEEVEVRLVRNWIDKNLSITCWNEIPDDLLIQSPYRRLINGTQDVGEVWQQLSEEYVSDGAVVTKNIVATDASVEDFASRRKEQLAAARWIAQNAGIDIGGANIDTSNETALMMIAAVQKAQANPALIIPWKTKEGNFAPLDAAQILAVGDAIFTHIQTCFGTEEARVAAIDAIVDDSELTEQQKLQAISLITWDDPS